MHIKTKKWIEAGKLLAKDSTQIVSCPECEEGDLIIRDQEIPTHPGKFERYLICNRCGKWNTLLMNNQ